MTRRAKTPDAGANSFALARDGRMNSPLHNAIRKALAGSSSRQPVDVSRLYKLGDEASVQAALLELYHAREVSCCLNIKRGKETTIWWSVGTVRSANEWLRPTKPKGEASCNG